jgi:4-hydroxy 2-oxovalerate aldolase
MKKITVSDITLKAAEQQELSLTFRERLAIAEKLDASGVDYIEVGYLKDNLVFDIDKTLYSSFDDVKKVLPYKNNLFLMINYGEVFLENLAYNSCGLSIAFKRKDYIAALNYCKELANKGFKIFINPMSVNLYSFDELSLIIQKINQIEPFAFTIVDSFGSMNKDEIIKIFEFANLNLDKNIALSLHLHDGLNQAMSAIKDIIQLEKQREIVYT